MTEREKIIERLRMVPTTDGGSHENLSAICRTIYSPVTGWTREACEILRATLIRLLGDTDSETSDGKRITDELRKWANDWDWLESTSVSTEYRLEAIADRIDAAHEDALSRAYMDVSDSEWVRLPKDADGEVIHIGDIMELDGEVREVFAVGVGVFVAWENYQYNQYKADAWRHWHPDTWECIIEDARAYVMNIGGSYLWKNKTDELVARCKALAGGEQ